jgi:TRAP-type C4-dicarboxylate transport system permease small subunit
LALHVQELLWQGYVTGQAEVGRGISAMPSLHVATAFLVYLVGRRVHRALGLGFGIFAVLILLGSVHLGWHYAIDGYAGIAGAGLIWWASGLAVRRFPAAFGLTPACSPRS